VRRAAIRFVNLTILGRLVLFPIIAIQATSLAQERRMTIVGAFLGLAPVFVADLDAF
jgi:hypothetical protein